MFKKPVLFLIGFYRMALSPLLPNACRFQPSCSNYAREAVEEYGAWKGGLMAVKRVLRCHPFNPGGYDPVIKLSDIKKTEGMPANPDRIRK